MTTRKVSLIVAAAELREAEKTAAEARDRSREAQGVARELARDETQAAIAQEKAERALLAAAYDAGDPS